LIENLCVDKQPTLPAEVRASLSPIAQAYIVFLESQIAFFRDQVAVLQMTVTKLQEQIADLQARTHQNSGNSARPPSSDLPGRRPHLKHKPSGRKRGGQKGHLGHARIQLGADQITARVEHRPVQCPGSTLPLDATLPAEGEPVRVQVWEIPPITAEVVEHRGDRVRCPYCAALVPPPDLPEQAFGPRLTAIGSLLHGRFRLSMRETSEACADLFRVPLEPGSVSTLCQEGSTALDEPYQDVRARVEAETHANVDETGWKQAGERRWLGVAVTARCTLFVVAKNRSAAVLASVLGETFAGVVGSDRSKAYRSVPLERRQICWAHLKRNLAAFAERGGEVGDGGSEAVGVVAKVFAAWDRDKDGQGDRAQFQAEIAPLRAPMQKRWERGMRLPSWMVRALCNDVGKLEPALWTFVTIAGVEPTNNAAERGVPSGPRPAVLWRKGCFGADSTAGNAFVAKILTASATCRQQEQQLLAYLTIAVSASRGGASSPSLLPASTAIVQG
jgi:transposase